MRSISDLITRTAPTETERPMSGPVACALFIAVLAVAIAGGAFWLGANYMTSSAQAAPSMLAFE